MSKNKSLGDQGEEIAVNELEKQGYTIVDRNFRKKYGEIDIIAKKGDTVAFVEVKTRVNTSMGLPREAVNLKKQNRIKNTAMAYITENQLYDTNFRFDVAEVMVLNDTVYFNYIENAFY